MLHRTVTLTDAPLDTIDVLIDTLPMPDLLTLAGDLDTRVRRLERRLRAQYPRHPDTLAPYPEAVEPRGYL